jgi:hypothetical protein
MLDFCHIPNPLRGEKSFKNLYSLQASPNILDPYG